MYISASLYTSISVINKGEEWQGFKVIAFENSFCTFSSCIVDCKWIKLFCIVSLCSNTLSKGKERNKNISILLSFLRQTEELDDDGRSFVGVELNDVMHLRMMDSFRKLSSHEDSNSFHSSSENERTGPPPLTSSSASSSSSKSSMRNSSFSSSSGFKRESKSNGKLNSTLNVLKDCKPQGDETYEKCCLFIYSHGSMRLLLLMDGEHSLELNVIQALVSFLHIKKSCNDCKL